MGTFSGKSPLPLVSVVLTGVMAGYTDYCLSGLTLPPAVILAIGMIEAYKFYVSLRT